MSNLRFTDSALSEWMRGNGQDSDIVISTRVRVARNLRSSFPAAGNGSAVRRSARAPDECAEE